MTSVKRKAIPISGRGSLWDFDMLRISQCLDSWLTDGGKAVSPTHRPLCTPQKHSFFFLFFLFCVWYSFLLHTE
jgi:hypothetical protein